MGNIKVEIKKATPEMIKKAEKQLAQKLAQAEDKIKQLEEKK